MDQFTEGYITCALWSSTAERCADCDAPKMADAGRCGCGGAWIDEPLDESYAAADVAPETLARMEADCRSFQDDNEALERWYKYEDVARAGHDFWLTRNHHGAGFWDRFSGGHPAEALGRKLTDAAHAYGSFDLYVGDDGMIHGQ